MEMVVTTGAIRRATLHSNSHHRQTNTQFYYRLDALPVNQPTVSKHWRDNSKVSPLNLKNANAKLLHFPTYWYGWGWMWCIPISQCTSVIQWYRQKDLFNIRSSWSSGLSPTETTGTFQPSSEGPNHIKVSYAAFSTTLHTRTIHTVPLQKMSPSFSVSEPESSFLLHSRHVKQSTWYTCHVDHTHTHRQCF